MYVVFSYGMGANGTAIWLRWLFEPETRPPELLPDMSNLIVITAQTGDEFLDTAVMVEQHIYPLLAKHRVRTVQTARAGHYERDGIVVLDDTREPILCLTSGAYALSEEMVTTATVPQSGGVRKHSQKFKGWVNDQWLLANIGDEPYVHVMGYDVSEPDRVAGDLALGLPNKRPWYPLVVWGWDWDDCERYIFARLGVRWKRSHCVECLAGETEVVTRDGVRPISALAGGHHQLLVPNVGTRGGLAHRGTFRQVEVKSFGVQRLYKVELRRSRSTKTVYATAGHRWILPADKGVRWTDPKTLERTTLDIRSGDVLRPLQAARPVRESMSHFAVAQGFVYGDGCRPNGARNAPAHVDIYDNGKDDALIPFFAHCEIRKIPNGRRVSGLPRTWKDVPTLAESRTFLLSWLAGYFAADGTVSKSGVATLYSADRRSIEFARDVAAVCGVGYTPIRSRSRIGRSGKRLADAPSDLHQINFVVRDLPQWFFLIKEHHRRVEALLSRSEGDRRPWKVVSVTPTDRVEEVFCAVVPGTQAFGLAEDLMTGNCPFAFSVTKGGRERTIPRLLAHPHQAMDALTMEYLAVACNPKQGLIAGKQLYDLIAAWPGGPILLDLFHRHLDDVEWAVYDVRRGFGSKPGDAMKRGRPARSMRPLVTGSRADMLARLERAAGLLGRRLETDGRHYRVWWRRRGIYFPTVEHLLTAAPALARVKTNPAFPKLWQDGLMAPRQLELAI